MALTLEELMADPTLLSKRRAELEKDDLHAQAGLHPDETYPFQIHGKDVPEEVYYEGLGALVEEHGICFPPMK